MLSVTAWVRRLIHNARINLKRAGALSTEEISEAKFHWIQATQKQSFLEEISLLQRGKEINSQSQIQSLSPFLDDKGILRVGGRLHMTNWNFEQKHPCILPANATFSELTVKKCHQQVMHSVLQDSG